jgi:ribonuclease P protein subunit RPR2
LKKAQAKEIAKERIEILIANALREEYPEFSQMQAALAKKIAMRFRIRMRYDHRQLFCKKCKAFIIPGNSARVRVGRSNTRAIRITCLQCGHTYRKIIPKK